MNPLRIRARSYRTFDELDVDLPTGCLAVIGENGAGKSSILNVIDLALFGAPGRATLADYLTDDGTDTELMVELTFDHAGDVYRVRRSYSARGRGQSKLDLEREGPGWHVEPDQYGEPEQVQSPPEWEPLTRDTAAATQELLEETLGLNRETFRASAFLAQGDGAVFTEAKAADRKRILADVLGLDIWDQLLEGARRDKRTAEASLLQLEGGLAGAEEELAARPDVEREREVLRTIEVEATRDLAAAEGTLAAAATAHRTASEAAAVRSAVEARARETGAALAALVLQRDAGARATTDRSVVLDEISSLSTPDQVKALVLRELELAELIRAHREQTVARDAAVSLRATRERERQALVAQAAVVEARAVGLRKQIGELEDEHLSSCPTCKQPLGAEARAETIATLTVQAVAAVDEGNLLKQQADQVEIPAEPAPVAPLTVQDLPADIALAELHALIQTGRQHLEHRGRLEERLATLDQTITKTASEAFTLELGAAQTAADQATTAIETLPPPADLAAIERQLLIAKTHVDQERARLEQAKLQGARVDERLVRLNQTAEKLAGKLAQRETLRAELDQLTVCERAYGRDGIPALIVENAAVPQIEQEANRILSELGTPYRVELRTERALKSSDQLRPALDIIVLGEGGERPYETFSGGERTRINLALRIALARLLAHRRGAESRLLAIDEAEFLDEQGTAALAAVLRDLEARGEFDRILLISHVPALREAFDQVLTVVKDGNRSRIETADLVEVVA